MGAMSAEKELALRALAAELTLEVDEVAVRGSGSAQFLYVVGKGGSAEISWDENDGLWVEYWESLEEAAEATGEFTCDDLAETKRRVVAFLNGNSE